MNSANKKKINIITFYLLFNTILFHFIINLNLCTQSVCQKRETLRGNKAYKIIRFVNETSPVV